LFQNNAGQQTAALNANGRLTANVIEAGEVVANGFAAQRITTGNLTVTDGAVIAGMTISGGILKGSAIEIQNGAKIGNFTISNGIFSANGVPAGIQMRLSNNLMEIDSSGLRIEQNSGGYAMNTSGNGMHYLRGSDMSMNFPTYEFAGASSWSAPGIIRAVLVDSSVNTIRSFGSPSVVITNISRTATGRYDVRITGSKSDMIAMAIPWGNDVPLSACIMVNASDLIRIRISNVTSGADYNSGFALYLCGMV
uniref:hypothetical protein n=1 Tax=Ruminococcus intestinalis TaxID=2763066 RepID=UPI003F8213A1